MNTSSYVSLFPFAEYWWFYLAFTLLIFVVLALDLGVFHKKAHEISFKEASIWTAIWIGLALIFNLLFYGYARWSFSNSERLNALPGFDAAEAAKQSGLEFLAGYIVEKSLAIDNIFIFAVVFGYFAIPKVYQHRVLFYGIIGAIFFRGVFIALGSYLMAYHAVVIFFGGLLMFTGIKMFFAGTQEIDPERNLIIRILRRMFKIYPKIEGKKFFIKKDGVLYATPLLICLFFLEASDIIFAIDSVPAIFALTREPLIVFTSNIFAILGLRSMYFMLAGFMDRFSYIKYGLASVLIFVGLKMIYLNDLFGGKFPISWSLLIIAILIGSSVILSLIMNPRKS